MVQDWHDKRSEKQLNQESVTMEMRAMEKKLTKYNVEQLGDIPMEREDGTMRVLVSKLKISTTEQLIRKYDINFCAFMEHNFHWMKVNSSANLASWFHKEEREMR